MIVLLYLLMLNNICSWYSTVKPRNYHFRLYLKFGFKFWTSFWT